MNPSSASYPYHHLFPCPPQNPNPNYFVHPLPHPRPPPPPPPLLQPQPLPPPPPQIPVTTTNATPSSDLSTTLTSLINLLSLSHQTLTSLSSSLFLSSQTALRNTQNSNFIPCPYNHHHLMPPESLFLHSLHCPSPLFKNPSSLLDSLHYPKTLTPQNPHKKPIFTQSIQEPNNTELCFSLDSFYDEFRFNFFYKDCPGVVNFNDLDSSKKTFTLPGVLLIECVNFVGVGGGGGGGGSEREIKMALDKNVFRLLPSDVWTIRREIESWFNYPSLYSYNVFCAMLRLNVIKGSDLRNWVIANSPCYGVVIDVYMRDHICLLFRLCLNAIRREALGLVGRVLDDKVSSFKCPVLIQVLMWIASQLSVLYGEVNAKCFAIHILNQCVLEAANEALLFPLESNLKYGLRDLDANGSDIRDVKLEENTECNVHKGADESVDGEVIFVSQVAAAIAALHERSLLEVKINGLRVPQSAPRYKRMAEHTYVSRRADEERRKRPNYRAIIEHDGLPRKHSSKQETNKTKTRQEFLAEERDYKRRRMSYRGKKLKRTTLQVMRDIIDEHMEEIKQAGGIGCFEKEAEDEGMSSNPSSASDFTMYVDERRKSNTDSSEAIRVSTSLNDASPQDYEQWQRAHHGRHEHLEYRRGTSHDWHDRELYSRSMERHRSHGRSHEGSSHRRERDDVELTRMKHYEKRSTSKSGNHDYKSSYSALDSANNLGLRKDDQKLDVRDRHLRKSFEKQSSNFPAQNAFEDRYDPKESHDVHEDDAYTGSKCARPEEFCE